MRAQGHAAGRRGDRMVDQQPMPMTPEEDPPRISTGSAGLDDILGGGLDPNRLYLYEGRPGTGKTTIALQFLLEGARRGERVLYITLSETERELRAGRRAPRLVARRGRHLRAGAARDHARSRPQELTVFHPAELELERDHQAHLRAGRAAQPDARRDRQPVRTAAAGAEPAALSPAGAGAEALLRQPPVHRVPARRPDRRQQNDLQLHSIAHGVVLLEQTRASSMAPSGGGSASSRCAASHFRGGFHDFTHRAAAGSRSSRGWSPPSTTRPSTASPAPSGNAELDALLGGGLERGTNALLIGAAGVGKSSLALTYAVAAAERGEHAVVFAFDEGRGTIEARAAHARASTLQETLRCGAASASSRSTRPSCRPASSPRSCAAAVEDGRARRDRHRQPERLPERHARRALPDPADARAAAATSASRACSRILVLAQHGLVGPMETPLDISYLSDAVVMLRYFEYGGTVRRALSVVKKRSGDHEHYDPRIPPERPGHHARAAAHRLQRHLLRHAATTSAIASRC